MRISRKKAKKADADPAPTVATSDASSSSSSASKKDKDKKNKKKDKLAIVTPLPSVTESPSPIRKDSGVKSTFNNADAPEDAAVRAPSVQTQQPQQQPANTSSASRPPSTAHVTAAEEVPASVPASSNFVVTPQPPQKYSLTRIGRLSARSPLFSIAVRPSDRETAAALWQSVLRESVAVVVVLRNGLSGLGSAWQFYPDEGEEMYLRGVCVCGNEAPQTAVGSHKWSEVDVRATEPSVRRSSSFAQKELSALSGNTSSPSKASSSKTRQETSVGILDCDALFSLESLSCVVADASARVTQSSPLHSSGHVLVLCDPAASESAGLYCIAHACVAEARASSKITVDVIAAHAEAGRMLRETPFYDFRRAFEVESTRELWTTLGLSASAERGLGWSFPRIEIPLSKSPQQERNEENVFAMSTSATAGAVEGGRMDLDGMSTFRGTGPAVEVHASHVRADTGLPEALGELSLGNGHPGGQIATESDASASVSPIVAVAPASESGAHSAPNAPTHIAIDAHSEAVAPKDSVQESAHSDGESRDAHLQEADTDSLSEGKRTAAAHAHPMPTIEIDTSPAEDPIATALTHETLSGTHSMSDDGDGADGLNERATVRREASAPASSGPGAHVTLRGALSEPIRTGRRSSSGSALDEMHHHHAHAHAHAHTHAKSGHGGHGDMLGVEGTAEKKKKSRRQSLSNWLRGTAPSSSATPATPTSHPLLATGTPDASHTASPESVSTSPLPGNNLAWHSNGTDHDAVADSVGVNPFVAYFQSPQPINASLRDDNLVGHPFTSPSAASNSDTSGLPNPFAARLSTEEVDDWPLQRGDVTASSVENPFDREHAHASWHFALETKASSGRQPERARSNSMSLNPFETAFAPNAPEWDSIHPSSQSLASAPSRRFSSFFAAFSEKDTGKLEGEALSMHTASSEFHALVAADAHADASELYWSLKKRLPEHCKGNPALATSLHRVLATWMYRLPLAATSLRYFVHVLHSVARLDRVSSLALARLLVDMGRVTLFDKLYRENRVGPSQSLAEFLYECSEFGTIESETRFSRHVSQSRGRRHSRSASVAQELGSIPEDGGSNAPNTPSHSHSHLHDPSVAVPASGSDATQSAEAISSGAPSTPVTPYLRRSVSSSGGDPDAGESGVNTLRVLSIRASADVKAHWRVLEALLALHDCAGASDYLIHVANTWVSGHAAAVDGTPAPHLGVSSASAGVTPGFDVFSPVEYVERMCAIDAEGAVDVAVLLATAVRVRPRGKVGGFVATLARAIHRAVPPSQTHAALAVRFLQRCLDESASVSGRLPLVDCEASIFNTLLELHLAHTRPPNASAAIPILTGTVQFDRRLAADLCLRAGMTLWHLLLLVDSRDRLVVFDADARRRVRPFWGDVSAALSKSAPTLSPGELDAVLALDTLGADGRIACLEGLLMSLGAARGLPRMTGGHVIDACVRLAVHVTTRDGVTWETVAALFERHDRDDLLVKFARETSAITPPDHIQSIFADGGTRFVRLCEAAFRCGLVADACSIVRTRLGMLSPAAMSSYVAASVFLKDYAEVRRVCQASSSLDPIALKRILFVDLDRAWDLADARSETKTQSGAAISGNSFSPTHPTDDHFDGDVDRRDEVLALISLCVRYGMVEDLVHFVALRGRLDDITRSDDALALCTPSVLPSTVSTLLALGWPRARILSAIEPFVSGGRALAVHDNGRAAARAVAVIDDHFSQLCSPGGGDSDPHGASWDDGVSIDPMRSVRIVRRLASACDLEEWKRCLAPTTNAASHHGDPHVSATGEHSSATLPHMLHSQSQSSTDRAGLSALTSSTHVASPTHLTENRGEDAFPDTFDFAAAKIEEEEELAQSHARQESFAQSSHASHASLHEHHDRHEHHEHHCNNDDNNNNNNNTNANNHDAAADVASDTCSVGPAASDNRRAQAIVAALRDGVGFACFSSALECEVAVNAFVAVGLGLEASEWLESALLRNFELSQRRDIQTLLCRLAVRYSPQTLPSILSFLDNVDLLVVASEARSAGLLSEYRSLMVQAGHPFEAQLPFQ